MNIAQQRCTQANGYITCGMYAFTPELRSAWLKLFSVFIRQAFSSGISAQALPQSIAQGIRFDTEKKAYLSPDMLLGHVCGYPYLQSWWRTHEPVCVAEFDLPGTRGQMYSSWLVCSKDHPARNLADFAGGVAAFNDLNSNSGMNVLRYAVSTTGKGKEFFFRGVESGSHLDSMRLVASGEADLAAVDAISYHHAIRLEPILENALRIVSQSVSTPGLPFIMHRGANIKKTTLVDALNGCIDQLDSESKSTLRINRFSAIHHEDYQCIAHVVEASEQNIFKYPPRTSD